MNKNVKKRLQILSLACLVAAPLMLRAEADPENIIKYRQNVMKANGAHMAAIAAIVQGKVPYREQLLDHALAVVEINRDVHKLFPEGSDFGDTAALDAVWKNKAEFNKQAQLTEKRSEALLKAVKAGNKEAQAKAFKALSDSCKNCHKDFRREEQG